MRRIIETTAIGLVLSLCSFISGGQTTNASTFVHSHPKFSFPESVEAFRRVEVNNYDQQGKDVGVGYTNPTPIAATVFVYPGPKDVALLPSSKSTNVSAAVLDQHFQKCKQDIVGNHPDAKLIQEGPCKLIQGNSQFEGKKAAFALNYKFGSVSEGSVSELYLFMIEPSVKFLATDRYFVKYRITYPLAKKTKAESEIRGFMTNLIWPIMQSNH